MEPTDPGELGPVAQAAGAIGAYQSDRLRRLRSGVEWCRGRQRPDLATDHAKGADAEAAPDAGETDFLICHTPSAPPAGADLQRRSAAVEQAGDRSARWTQRDV